LYRRTLTYGGLVSGGKVTRLLYGLMPGSPFRPGLHLIAPDRPGYGLSDFYPRGRTIADYPDDVVALADSLGVDRFAVFGASGGGLRWTGLQQVGT